MKSSESRIPGLQSVSVAVVCLLVAVGACWASSGLDEQVMIDAVDTRLFAEIRGRDGSAPLLLYLHGGPGSPLGVPVFRAYGGHLLENHFIVVYLHQRGIMKSPRVSDQDHRIERYVEDVDHVIGYLGQRFPGREIHLLGHSWGGVLAYLYLTTYPDSIRRLVAVCAPIDVKGAIAGRVEMLLQWAFETGNDKAVLELSPLRGKSVIDEPDEFEILRTWSPKAYDGWARNLSRERVDDAIDYEDELPEWLRDQAHIEELMLAQLLRVDLSDEISKLDTPLLCIVGGEDVNTPWYLVQEGIKGYGGHVEFRVFENSHHMPFIDEEVRFVETVVGFLSPE